MNIEMRQDPLWGHVVFLSDGATEVAAALDYGIRVVHLSRTGMENLFYRQPDDLSDGLTTPEGWRIFGGHRFWTAPESNQSYYPDSDPVACQVLPDGALLTQKTDPWTGLEKQVSVRLREDGRVQVEHRLTNRSGAPVTAAAWGVSTLRPGGEAVVPLPDVTPESEFTPHRVLAFWNNTSLADPRLRLGRRGIAVRHDPTVKEYFKIGVYSETGSVRFRNLGQTLEVTFEPSPLTECEDLGCNVEIYADPFILEVETLGARRTLEPGQSVSHTEFWKVT